MEKRYNKKEVWMGACTHTHTKAEIDTQIVYYCITRQRY